MAKEETRLLASSGDCFAAFRAKPLPIAKLPPKLRFKVGSPPPGSARKPPAKSASHRRQKRKRDNPPDDTNTSDPFEWEVDSIPGARVILRHPGKMPKLSGGPVSVHCWQCPHDSESCPHREGEGAGESESEEELDTDAAAAAPASLSSSISSEDTIEERNNDTPSPPGEPSLVAQQSAACDLMTAMQKAPEAFEYLCAMMKCDVRIALALRDYFDVWDGAFASTAGATPQTPEELHTWATSTPHNAYMRLSSILGDLKKDEKTDLRDFINCLEQHVPVASPIVATLKAHLAGQPWIPISARRLPAVEIPDPGTSMHVRSIGVYDFRAYERMVLQLADPDVRGFVAVYYGKMMGVPAFDIVLAACYHEVFLEMWEAMLERPKISLTFYLLELARSRPQVMEALKRSGAAAILERIETRPVPDNSALKWDAVCDEADADADSEIDWLHGAIADTIYDRIF